VPSRGVPFPSSSTTPAAEDPDASRTGLGQHNLRLSVAELTALLADAMRQQQWMNAYLFAAGINQVVEDHLHSDVYVVGRVGHLLLSGGSRAHVVAGRAAMATVSVVQDVRSRRRSSRETLAWQRSVATLVGALARIVSADVPAEEADSTEVATEAEALLDALDALPVALRDRVLRLPSCFQAFDMDVADVRRMAAEFAGSWPNRSRPLIIAGVRTSGSYLAPLCAAILESQGYTDVGVLTLRPQHPLLRGERQLLRGFAKRDGLVLVIDDPPGSGQSIARVAGTIARLGVPRESIVLLLPLFGSRESLPAGLRDFPTVLLPADEWAINAKLTPEAVGRVFGRLVGAGTSVEAVEPVPLPGRRWQRSHERALFRVDLVEGGTPRSVSVLVEGVGIGYFGEHALAVAEDLRDYVPEVFGLEGGCLYRTWLPETARSCPPGSAPDTELVTAAATYILERRQAFRVSTDRSVAAVDEMPVWEVASYILSHAFGRGAPVARVLLVDALAKHLLRVADPSVVDGSTSLSNWFADERNPGRYLKVDFAGRSFWNLGLLCYDAAFDLAGAALSSPSDPTADDLRSSYARLGGAPIGEERWFLYELAQLWGQGRTRPDGGAGLERESSRSLQRYMARLFLADLAPNPDGELCALDLDGVLDTETLGFPGTTASGAIALRALVAHGYCPVLVSGRSAEDVADRCRAYGLLGGVAEYGAVVLTTAPEAAHALLSDAARGALERARADLGARDDVGLDEAYRYSVRAFRTDRRGRRGPVDQQTVDAVLAASGDPAALRTVVGESQTDFVAAEIDKGDGVRALAARLGRRKNGARGVLAFAVGDTAADLPMLREAAIACAPAQARRLLKREGVEVVSAPYQAGLALAVGRLLGHEPGSCPTCRAPELTPENALLVSLLSAGECRRVGLARRFLELRRRVRAAIKAEELR